MAEQLFDVKTAAARLGVSKQTVYRMIKAVPPEIDFICIRGTRIRISEISISKYLEQRTTRAQSS